jgi:hypothetical protein
VRSCVWCQWQNPHIFQVFILLKTSAQIFFCHLEQLHWITFDMSDFCFRCAPIRRTRRKDFADFMVLVRGFSPVKFVFARFSCILINGAARRGSWGVWIAKRVLSIIIFHYKIYVYGVYQFVFGVSLFEIERLLFCIWLLYWRGLSLVVIPPIEIG